jgi:predicted DNA-binding transcriptional regulator AlpA
MSRLLTAEELAERWQVPTGWIYAKCRTGELPKVPLPGKYIRFRLDVIEEFERGELDSTNEAA